MGYFSRLDAAIHEPAATFHRAPSKVQVAAKQMAAAGVPLFTTLERLTGRRQVDAAVRELNWLDKAWRSGTLSRSAMFDRDMQRRTHRQYP